MLRKMLYTLLAAVLLLSLLSGCAQAPSEPEPAEEEAVEPEETYQVALVIGLYFGELL